jgi:hypothetical protein
LRNRWANVLRLCQAELLCNRDSSQGSTMSGYRVITQKAWPWTIVSNVFRECHTPCMLIFFWDFKKEYRRLIDTKGYIFRQYPINSPNFSSGSQVITQVAPTPQSFLLSNHQSTYYYAWKRIICICSQTCIKRSPLEQGKDGLKRLVTS